MFQKQNIVIYCDRLLPHSETFVRSQAEALQSFIPYYAGSRLVSGLSLPEAQTLVVNYGGLVGKISEVFYKLFGFAPAFFQSVRQLNPALIHSHFGPNGATALPLARNLAVPLVVTFHGYDATMKDEYARHYSHSYRAYLRRRELLKHQAQLFIAVSEFIKQKLLKQGFPHDKIVVHHIGVDTEAFQPDPSVERSPIVLFVGRLVEKKGCEYLIRAMSQVQKLTPNVELVIIGDGSLKFDLERLAAKTLYRYRFLGKQPSHVVKSWMNQALLLAVPSITATTGDSEGLPTVLLEAQAMGLPIISSFHSGIPELIVHGETGFLVAERDWEGLTKHIFLLMKDQNLRTRFTQAGQDRIRTSFNLYKQTQLLEEIYNRVLSDRANISTATKLI